MNKSVPVSILTKTIIYSFLIVFYFNTVWMCQYKYDDKMHIDLFIISFDIN